MSDAPVSAPARPPERRGGAARRVLFGLGVVLCVLLVAMAVVGFKAATAPVPGFEAGEEECSAVEKDVKKFVARGEVQVSVFNASNRSGLAGRTLDRLVERGFKPGNPGNAPDGVKVRRAVVWTTEEDDSSALLVARNLGTGVRVIVTEQDLGRAYRSTVDPRLNYEQALETAMLVVRKQARLAAAR